MWKLRKLAWWSGMEYFLFLYVSNSYVAAVVAYLANEAVVLGHGCISVFIPVSVVKRSFRDCWFWHLHLLGVRSWYMFLVLVVLEEGTIMRSFFNIYVEILIQNAGVRSWLIWWRICRVMGVLERSWLMYFFFLHRRNSYWNCFVY